MFNFSGSEIVWDRWRLHFGVHPRRGIEVFLVALAIAGRIEHAVPLVLLRQGFARVYNLGGFEDAVKAGLPAS